jgi:hypothetical protein
MRLAKLAERIYGVTPGCRQRIVAADDAQSQFALFLLPAPLPAYSH